MPEPSPRRFALTRPKEPPEDSIRLRVIVAALVMLAVVAVIAQGALDAATAAAALVVVPAGYAFSYVRRARPNVLVKVFLALGLLVALGAFLQRVRLASTVDEARMPLASLFIWVQALHAFDVPRRRDLAFSVVSSVILMAEAASLSFSTGFALLLLPWAALAGAWLYATQRPVKIDLDRPRFVRRTTPSARRRPLAIARIGAGSTAAVVTGVLVVFLAMPRLPGAFVRLPPFALHNRPVDVSSFGGAVVNPTLPSASGDGIVNFSPTAYPGFGDRVDLRARGRLSDRLVMLVRSPQPALWRGQVYDTFDGTTWTESDDATTRIGAGDDKAFMIPMGSDATTASAVGEHRVVTTFYVQTPQPNIVFAAYVPERVYFPAAQLAIGAGLSLRSPILLDRGLTYSVVSDVPVTDATTLRAAAGPVASDVSSYLQLPSDLPARDVRLARRITAGATTEYDAVIAVQRWLRTHTVYDLGVPSDPPGVDAVDEFLFERRRGFCEHIASAMALLLRSVGVPTRFVTGFGPGERNPLTGYFQVRESDAHAWVEVLYPGVGWVPYDPTFGVPPADPSAAWFIAPDVLRAAGRWLSHAVPRPVRDAVGRAGHAVAVVADGALAGWPFALALALFAVVAAWLLRRRPHDRGPPPTRAALAFERLTRALGDRGTQRTPSQTPTEYLSVLDCRDLEPAVVRDAELIVRTFERVRFAAERPDDDEVAAALAAADRVRDATRPSLARRAGR
ncbi:MAG: transglutaminase TgpA family protein [Actinomycetota bacterium]